MSAENPAPHQPIPPRPPRRVERALTQWMMREARIAAVEPLSLRFKLIDLKGEDLQGVAWAPGQKLQVMLGAGLLARTYTPMLWDRNGGATRLLAFAHGDGPGSLWSRDVALDDTVRFFGPRRSLDAGLPSPILFGDETSFALAASLGDRAGSIVFEVDSIVEAEPVLAALGLADAILVEREPGDAHLHAVEALLEGGTHFLLTGNAAAIQRLSRTLKDRGTPSAAIRAKAYWARGKRGLD